MYVFPKGKLLYTLAIQLDSAAIALLNWQACLVYLCECHFQWAVGGGPKIFHLKSSVTSFKENLQHVHCQGRTLTHQSYRTSGWSWIFQALNLSSATDSPECNNL